MSIFIRNINAIRPSSARTAAAFLVALLAVSCGRAEKNQDRKGEAGDLQSEPYAAELSQIDEAADEGFLAMTDAEEAESTEAEEDAEDAPVVATSESDQNTMADTAPEAMAPDRQLPRHRTCVDSPSEGKTTVTIKKKSLKVGTLFGKKAKNTAFAGQVVEIVRVWSRDGKSVGCDAATQRALIDRADMDGVKLEVSFKRKAGAGALSLPQGRAGVAGYLAEGYRTFNFSQKTENSQIIRTVSIESTVTRKGRINVGDDSNAAKLVIKTEDGPLVVETVRDAQSLKIQSRTLVSGKFVATRGNGASLSASFDKVRFVKEEGCARPVSGTIAGELIKKDGENRTFQIDFAKKAGGVKLLKAAEILTQRDLNRVCGSED